MPLFPGISTSEWSTKDERESESFPVMLKFGEGFARRLREELRRMPDDRGRGAEEAGWWYGRGVKFWIDRSTGLALMEEARSFGSLFDSLSLRWVRAVATILAARWINP